MAFKELKPHEWLDEISYGLEYRRQFGLEEIWATMEAIYYNVHHTMANDGPNIFLSQGDSMLSMITVPDPHVQVKPRTMEAVRKAPIVQSIDNTLLDELELTEEGERAALHAYIFGTGFFKMGYDSEWGYTQENDIGGPLNLGMSLTQLNQKGTRRIEHNSKITPGMPWGMAVMPHDVVLPWGTRDIETTPWIAHRVVRHIDDLKADPKYQNMGRLQAQLSMEDYVNSYKTALTPIRGQTLRGHSHAPAEYVEIWEIMDRRTGKIYAITKDHDKYLRRVTNALQIRNRLPWAMLSFTPRVRAAWTTPDTYYLFHVQNELSDVAKQRTKQRRIATPKFLYSEDMISDEELLKILSTDVGAAIKVKGGVGELAKAIARLDNQTDQTLSLEEEHLRQNAREQIGFSRNQLGEYTGGRKTATEVNTVDRSSLLRMSRRGLAMQRFYGDVVEIMNGIIFTHWQMPRYVEVLGETKVNQWQQITGPALDDRYGYKVTLVNEKEEEARMFEALQLYMFLIQDPAIDPVALREFLVNEINNPAFERLFNANILAQMSLLRANGGVVQQDGGQRQAPQLPNLSGQAPQGSNGTANTRLAQRGINA